MDTSDLPRELAEVLADERLSYAARGAYAASYARRLADPDAPVTVRELIERSERDAFKRASTVMRELEQAGYVIRTRTAGADLISWSTTLTTPSLQSEADILPQEGEEDSPKRDVGTDQRVCAENVA